MGGRCGWGGRWAFTAGPVFGLHGYIAAKEYGDILKYEVHSTVQTLLPLGFPIVYNKMVPFPIHMANYKQIREQT